MVVPNEVVNVSEGVCVVVGAVVVWVREVVGVEVEVGLCEVVDCCDVVGCVVVDSIVDVLEEEREVVGVVEVSDDESEVEGAEVGLLLAEVRGALVEVMNELDDDGLTALVVAATVSLEVGDEVCTRVSVLVELLEAIVN